MLSAINVIMMSVVMLNVVATYNKFYKKKV